MCVLRMSKHREEGISKESRNMLSGCFTCYESTCVCMRVRISVRIMYVKHREERIAKESRNMLNCFNKLS